MPNPVKVLIGLAAVAAIAGAGYFLATFRDGNDPPEVPVSGNIECTVAEVSFKIPGRVLRRDVDEGQMVRQGQEIAVLESADLEADVRARQADLDTARSAERETLTSFPMEVTEAAAAMRKAEATWKDLQQGSRAQEIQMARAEEAAAQQDLDRLESDYARAQQLHAENVMTQEDYDRAEAAYRIGSERLRQAKEKRLLTEEGSRQQQIAAAKAAWEQAVAEYDRVAKGPRQEKNVQAEARVKQAEAALALAQTKLQYAKIVSPLAGMVLSKNVEPGEYVAPGTPVVTVGDLVNVWLRAYIQESDLGRVKLGQKVSVTTDTYPKKVYWGRVSFISPQAEFTPKNVQTEKERVKLVYRIKIDIRNPSMELKPGMPADAKIVLGTEQSQGAKP